MNGYSLDGRERGLHASCRGSPTFGDSAAQLALRADFDPMALATEVGEVKESHGAPRHGCLIVRVGSGASPCKGLPYASRPVAAVHATPMLRKR